MKHLITVLLLLCTLLPAQALTRVSDIMYPRERQFIQQLIPSINLDEIYIETYPYDGPKGTLAWVDLDVENPSYIIWLDTYDFGHVPLRQGALHLVLVRMTVVHELVHIAQTHRGREYREQMLEWMETLDYGEHPHEIEAYAMGDLVSRMWPF